MKLQLADLYFKRADCFMKMADRYNKPRYAKLAHENTAFILDEKNHLMADLVTEKHLYEQIKLLDTRVKQFIKERPNTVAINNNVSLK